MSFFPCFFNHFSNHKGFRFDFKRISFFSSKITIFNFKIENCTKQGTVLNTGNVYKREEVRYIQWTADYVDNVVKAGGKTYGTLYVKYMKKDKYSDSWETLDYQGLIKHKSAEPPPRRCRPDTKKGKA